MPCRQREEVEVQLYPFSTPALEGTGWSGPGPGRFTPKNETRYSLYKRLGGSQGLSWWVQKISPPQEIEPRTVQAVASRYRDCSMPAADKTVVHHNIEIDIQFTISPVCNQTCTGDDRATPALSHASVHRKYK